ncbi:FadD3 family acyl-CoA ligase [Sphingomonas sanxanigenens]|uniref:Fatty acid--CoA ligase n=1 Tax=Sphingomonas sanxanigenens DSM 19645 = NX02 TaxID=1123269 RepID=W0AEA6_9SPHN|nr:FadD3 family acyl-CoA ligase [Sphingomonas sanxanigenens]AHE54623.1 fatty acid--CoA ligase [Sphingomonas sanxanigenens DSM 19645 = NX02]
MLPNTLTMGALIDEAAARWPDTVFLHEEDGRTISFAAFRDGARRVSRALIARGGAPGHRIAIWAPNSAGWAIAAAGAVQIGVQLIPLNTRFKGAEAADILARGGVRWLFSVRDFLGFDYAAMLAGRDLPLLEEIVFLDDGFDAWLAAGEAIDDAAIDARIAAVAPDDVADVLFTSGTTGRPKGAMSSHMQNLRTFQAWSDAVGLREGDRYLVVNPFFHTFGYKAGWIAALLQGATVYPMAMFDAASALRRIAAARISVLPGPPTIFQSLLDAPERATADISSLRLSVTGAASVPPVLIRRMREDLGIDDVLTAYGLTESCGCVSATKAGDPAELVAASCGTPIPGVEVRLVDPEGSDVAAGEAGELLVRGFNVMKGYLDDPAATAEAIDAEGWLRTGDIATQDARGYLKITDRAKDMFICGGFNCYPAEIEARILEHPEVARVAVVGRPHERLGEVGHAVIVAKPGAAQDAAAFLAWCRDEMANYKAPRTVEWVAELPLNAAGKVQRFMLK